MIEVERIRTKRKSEERPRTFRLWRPQREQDAKEAQIATLAKTLFQFVCFFGSRRDRCRKRRAPKESDPGGECRGADQQYIYIYILFHDMLYFRVSI